MEETKRKKKKRKRKQTNSSSKSRDHISIGDNEESLSVAKKRKENGKDCDRETCKVIHKTLGLYRVRQKRMEELQGKGVHVKMGKWNKSEDKHLLKNIDRFSKRHRVEDIKTLFATGIDDADAWINVDKVRFRWRICRGIPRPPGYIFERAKRILDINNHKGQFSHEEVQLLLKLQKEHGNKWAKIATKMNRHRQSLRDKFKEQKRDKVEGAWSKTERQQLRAAVKEIVSDEDLKNGQIIPWSEVEKKVPTRTANQCRRQWCRFICWSNTEKRTQFWRKHDYVTLIERIYKTPDLCDEGEIDWQDMLQHFPHIPTAGMLKVKWYLLKTKYVPDHQMKTLDEIVSKLHSVVGRGTFESSRTTKSGKHSSKAVQYLSNELISETDDTSDDDGSDNVS